MEADAVLASILVRFLARKSYEVERAKDGLTAWAQIEAAPKHYDVVVTDHIAGNLSGLDLLKRVRAAGFPLAVVVYCSGVSAYEAACYQQMYVSAVVLKTAPPEELLRAVEFAARASEDG